MRIAPSSLDGWPEDSDNNFSLGKTSITQIAPVAGGASISRSGLVGYFTEASNDNSVCELDRADKQICLKGADAFDRISVSDSGEALFTTHVDGGCFYRKHKIARANPPQTGDDQCVGIAIWMPGSGKVVVKELAKHPQWLTPKAAEALRTCAATSQGCFGKH